MAKFQGKYRIESNRWKYWDYSRPGFYFITICTHSRDRLLGEIRQGKMHLSQYGEIVKNEILKIPEYNDRTKLSEWIIMPDHIHLLIELTPGDIADDAAGVTLRLPLRPTKDEIKQYRKNRRKMIIPKILGKLQMQTSKQINIIRNTPGKQNWQSDYHDHIVRNNAELQRIKKYIIANPINWKS